MPRLARPILLAACLVFSAALPAAAQATLVIDGHFKEGFGRAASSQPCDLVPPFCGTGSLRGLGKVTTLFFPDTGIKTITLVSDGSTLVMQETFVSFSTPGNSGNAPGAMRSFGNPFRLVVSWEALPDESTGIFAGGMGTGITTVRAAGDVLIIDTNGTLTWAD